jgi:hypothetical protein
VLRKVADVMHNDTRSLLERASEAAQRLEVTALRKLDLDPESEEGRCVRGAGTQTGHTDRTSYRFVAIDASAEETTSATSVGARTYIESARDLATAHFERFLATAMGA